MMQYSIFRCVLYCVSISILFTVLKNIISPELNNTLWFCVSFIFNLVTVFWLHTVKFFYKKNVRFFLKTYELSISETAWNNWFSDTVYPFTNTKYSLRYITEPEEIVFIFYKYDVIGSSKHDYESKETFITNTIKQHIREQKLKGIIK